MRCDEHTKVGQPVCVQAEAIVITEDGTTMVTLEPVAGVVVEVDGNDLTIEPDGNYLAGWGDICADARDCEELPLNKEII